MIRRLNPIIRGWANYYRTHVAAEIFDKLDQYLWRLTYKWARFSHANKSASWVTARYFGKFNKARQDRWVFGDRHSGSYMHRFSWTSIVRHQPVKQGASPDDPALAEYWASEDANPSCRSTTPACGSSKPRTDAVRSARPRSSPSSHKPRAIGTVADRTRTATIVKPVTGTPDRLTPSHTPNATARHFVPGLASHHIRT